MAKTTPSIGLECRDSGSTGLCHTETLVRFDVSPTNVKLPESWRLPKHTDMTCRSMLDLEYRRPDSQQSANNIPPLKRMMEDQKIYITTIATGLQLYLKVYIHEQGDPSKSEGAREAILPIALFHHPWCVFVAPVPDYFPKTSKDAIRTQKCLCSNQDPWGRVESVNSEGVSREEKLWACYE